jgi:hypothetical protein
MDTHRYYKSFAGVLKVLLLRGCWQALLKSKWTVSLPIAPMTNDVLSMSMPNSTLRYSPEAYATQVVDGVMAEAGVKASYAVAYGDSFAIALAQAKRGSAVTGDDEIRQCALVPVDWIGFQTPVAT